MAGDGQKIVFNPDNKYDLQLSAALVRERALADIFQHSIFDGTKPVRIELKTETWLWERTGNICIEYRADGKPSGIAITEADIWVHELRRDGQTLCYLMIPIPQLKELARKAYAEGRYHQGGGDGGRFCNVLIPLSWIRGD
jgi:hypothetical protein